MKLDYVLVNIPSSAEVLFKRSDQAHIKISKDDFLNFINYLVEHCEYRMLLDISFYQDVNEISLWLLSLETHQVIGVVTEKDHEVVSISELNYYFKNISSLAFQYNEYLGENFFRGVENFRKPIEKFQPKKSVLVSETDDRIQDIIRINSHFNRFGDIDLGVISEDDIALELDYQINGIKKNIHKYFQDKPVRHILNQLHKVDGASSMNLVINFAMALEKLMEIEVPDKAKAVRMVFLEFARIFEIIEYISSISYSIQATNLYHKCLLWIQNVERIMVYYSGNIYHLGIFDVGGILRDVPSGWLSFCHKHLKEIQEEVNEELGVILANSLWNDRLNIGYSDAKSLVDWGICSTVLRAAGINSDLRKRQSYYFYDEVIFDVPVAIEGSVYDRLILAFMECQQSFEIIFQVLDNLPTGRLMDKDFEISRKIQDGNTDFTADKSLTDGVIFQTLESFSNIIHTSIKVEDNKIKDIKINTDSLK
jgi:NADH:ubiquinone oxidoreductase subunit D